MGAVAPVTGMPRRKPPKVLQPQVKRRKREQLTKMAGIFPVYNRRIRGSDSPCDRRAERRAVLLAIGKVNKPGGAPGPYKTGPRLKCR